MDIADLTVVHLRNIPPTPANYAQRSGRAGRGGKPALVLTFSSYGNAHDQYFLEVATAFQQVASLVGAPITESIWYNPQWLQETVNVAPIAFNRSLDHWRELYRTAVEQRDAARRKIDNPRLGKDDREVARQQESEALREIDLLLNRGERITESDFYPYRYLATEGFLPGYNFPRLPLRALVWTGERTESIDRPRFLGLSEFGPLNVIYHEGRKHRVKACHVPAGGLDRRISRAKICLNCGYIHPRDEAMVDLCRYCGATLDGFNSQFPQRLFEQPTVKADRWVRISSEEEERAREGYHITTHFRFSPGTAPKIVMVKPEGDSDPVLEVAYMPQAELWRINHGWRRSADRNGFSLEGNTGAWVKQEGDIEEGGDTGRDTGPIIPGVKPFVNDSRNILLLRPLTQDSSNVSFLKTLAYALQRGIQVTYQVEEQEVAVELIGRDNHQRILLWEAAEGGTGVWDRILTERGSFAEIAQEALRICHFDPNTGEEIQDSGEPCGVACYDCLLSYANQMDHRFLNRNVVKDFLMGLARTEIISAPVARDFEEQYQRLSQRLDPASPLKRNFLTTFTQANCGFQTMLSIARKMGLQPSQISIINEIKSLVYVSLLTILPMIPHIRLSRIIELERPCKGGATVWL